MNIQLIGDHFDLDPKIRTVIEKKVVKPLERLLQTFAEDLQIASIRIKKLPRWGYKANFDMKLPGKHIFAEEVANTASAALLRMRDNAKRQIKSYKDKLQQRDKP